MKITCKLKMKNYHLHGQHFEITFRKKHGWNLTVGKEWNGMKVRKKS